MMPTAYLLGSPVNHSLSPVMQRAAFSALGVDWRYEAVDVEPNCLGVEVARLLRTRNTVGANITLPHKVSVMEYLDRLSPSARRTLAVNTVTRDAGGALVGHNTDATGFRALVSELGLGVQSSETVVLGSGGAARAAVAVLADSGAGRITVVSRSNEQLETLQTIAGQTDCVVVHCRWERLRHLLLHTGLGGAHKPILLVNATPIGMWPHVCASPVPRSVISALPPGSGVLDLIYRPVVTSLMSMARAAGFRALGGLGMLVGQGVEALSLWIDEPVPAAAQAAMLAAVASSLEGATC